MNLDPDLLLAIFLISIGAILWIAVRLSIKEPKTDRSTVSNEKEWAASKAINANQEAVFIIGAGGKLKSINLKALALFDIKEDEIADLEHLAMKANPKDAFLQVCAQAGAGEFSISGRQIKATHFALGSDSLISLQPMETISEKTVQDDAVDSGDGLADFVLSISASLDVNETITRILEKINRLIPAEMTEINIWDEDSTNLLPYRIYAAGSEKNNVKIYERQKLGEGFSGLIIESNQVIWLDEIQNHPNYHKISNSEKHQYKSMIGFPLVVGHEILGTLEFYSTEKAAFMAGHNRLAAQICPKISTAINNAILYRVENQRTRELSSLAQLAQSLRYSREPEKIFEKMLATIQPVLPLEIIGFLIFNESTRMLEAQKPFCGLPNPFVDIFKAEIKKGSTAEELLTSQDVLLAENAQVDLHWISLGLDHMARAASLRETVLIPLVSGGNSFGFLLASNHRNKGAAFSQAEMHLLMIVADQAAPIIENMTLVEESNQKAQRAETLRKIALFASSNAKLDEILRYSLEELALLLNADTGALLLLNQEATQLRLHPNSMFGEPANGFSADFLFTNDAQYPFTITGSQKPLVIGQFDAAEPVIPFYQALMDGWEIKSLLIVPLLIRDEGIGEIWIGSRRPNEYDPGDFQTLIPAAGQLAGVIEQQNLSTQTDDTLRKKVEQLSALNRTNRLLNSTLDLEEILQIIINEAVKISNASGGLLQLFEGATVTDKVSQLAIHVGERWNPEFPDGKTSILGDGKSHFLQEASEIAALAFPKNTRAVMIFPLYIPQTLHGGLALFSRKKAAFNQALFDELQLFMNYAHNSFENAIIYGAQTHAIKSLHQKLDIQQRIFSVSQWIPSGDSLGQVTEKLFEEMAAILPVSAMKVYRFNPDGQGYDLLSACGDSRHNWPDESGESIAWENAELFLNPDYQHNGFYAIPQPKYALQGPLESPQPPNAINLLLYPLNAAPHEPTGLVVLETSEFDTRDAESSQLLELFMLQIQSYLEKSPALHYTAEAARQPGLQALTAQDMAVDEVQAISLQEVTLAAAFSDELLVAALSESDSVKTLNMLAMALLENTAFTACILFVKNKDQSLHTVEILNLDTEKSKIDTLLGQKNPIECAIRSETIVQVEELSQEDDWTLSPFVTELQARSFLAIPIQLSGEETAAIFLFSSLPTPGFSVEHLEVLKSKTNLLCFMLQCNQKQQTELQANHFDRELLAFSNSVHDLDTHIILNKLLAKALEMVPAAQAGWVGEWDENQQRIFPIAARGYKNNNAVLEITFSDADWSIPLVVYENHIPLVINDLNFASNYPLNPRDLLLYQQATDGALPLGNMLIPIANGEDGVGILVLENFDHSAPFSKADQDQITAMVSLLMPAIVSATRYQEAEKKVSALQHERIHANLLLQTGSTLTEGVDLGSTLRSTLKQLLQGIEAEFGAIYLEEGGHVVQASHSPGNSDEPDLNIPDERIVEAVAFFPAGAEVTTINETYKLENWNADIARDFPYASLLTASLSHAGQCQGTMVFAHSEPFFFTEAHVALLQAIIPQIAFVINSLHLSNRLFEQSTRISALASASESMESQSKAILDSFADAIVITDVKGKIHFMNLAAEKLLGINIYTLKNEAVAELAAAVHTNLAAWLQTVQTWTDNPALTGYNLSYNEKIVLKNQRILAVYAAPVFWQRTFFGTLSLFRDVTIDVQVDRIKSDFVANVSQELRSPLTSIKGYADVLLMGAVGEIPAQQKRFINIISDNAARLGSLVEHLLDIAKIETGKVDLYSQAVYLEDVISQVVKEYAALAETESKPTNFDLRIPKNLKPVRGDTRRIYQIINNLISNSYNYSNTPVKVMVRVTQTEANTQVDIQDFGIGIKAEDQDRIFERFYRGEDELIYATRGSGLGLAVTKTLVELHGGQIWFYSSGNQGEGSIFSFTIPVFVED